MKRLHRFGLTAVLLAALVPVAACSKDPEQAKRDHLAKGNEYVKQNKLAEAVIEYRNALNLDARFGEARYQLARTYVRQRDFSKAYREFVRAAELLPDNVDAQLDTGQFHLLACEQMRLEKSDDLTTCDDAKRIAEALLKKDPKNVRAKLLLANAMVGLNNVPEAVEELKTAVELDPKRVGTYMNLAAIQAVRGDVAQAEATFRSALEVDPNSVDARIGLARLYAGTGDLAKAETLLKEVRAIKPADDMASRNLAAIYLTTGRIKEAEAPLKELAESSKAVGPRLGLAQYYLAAGRTAEALPILNSLLKEPEGLVTASTLLARVEFAEGRRAEAQKRLDELLAQQPTNASVLVLKAQFLAAEGRLDEALVRTQAATTADPRLPAAHYVAGIIYLQKQDRTAALKSFSEVLKLRPRDETAKLQVAKIHLASGRADLALPLADGVVANQPDNLDARLTLVRALVQSKDVKRAETEAAALLAKAPTSGDAQAVVAAVAAFKEDVPAARAAYTRALEMNPYSVAALSGLLELDIRAKKNAEAKARLEKTLASAPPQVRPALLELAGRTYMALGDAKKSEETWRKLLEVQPDNLVAYAALGQIFYQQGRLDDARMEFERYAERQPTAIGAHTLIAMILQIQNRIPEAQKRYERTLEINPNAGVAANNLAWLYAEQNTNLDTALQLAKTAKSQMPNSAEVDDTLGWVYYKKGLHSLAIGAFQDSLAKSPKNPNYLYHLGLAYVKNNEKDKARDALDRAVKAWDDQEKELRARGVSPNFPDRAEARKVLASLG